MKLCKIKPILLFANLINIKVAVFFLSFQNKIFIEGFAKIYPSRPPCKKQVALTSPCNYLYLFCPHSRGLSLEARISFFFFDFSVLQTRFSFLLLNSYVKRKRKNIVLIIITTVFVQFKRK